MCENDGYKKLVLEGLIVVIVGLFAIYRPGLLVYLFAYPLFVSLKIYHVLWLMAMLVLVKRMIPKLNNKMSLGKIFARNFVGTGGDTDKKRLGFQKDKRKADSGALRSVLYWFLLLLVMWMWRVAGILPDIWLYVIVLFFIFMDQFCISVFCPFQWLMGNKCCSTCRINNWGYCMAFSPLIFIATFWTYSIIFLSIANLFIWEYLYFKHPERFYDIYNAKLMCKNCDTHCRRKSAKSN
jgi:hypothetical protein